MESRPDGAWWKLEQGHICEGLGQKAHDFHQMHTVVTSALQNSSHIQGEPVLGETTVLCG